MEISPKLATMSVTIEPLPSPRTGTEACEAGNAAILAAALIRIAEMATVSALRVPFAGLRHPSRGPRRESRARQIAIYLPRRIWGFDAMDLSRSSGRERTTVRHACARIASARASETFDLQLAILEQAIRRCVDETLGPICR